MEFLKQFQEFLENIIYVDAVECASDDEFIDECIGSVRGVVYYHEMTSCDTCDNIDALHELANQYIEKLEKLKDLPLSEYTYRNMSESVPDCTIRACTLAEAERKIIQEKGREADYWACIYVVSYNEDGEETYECLE